MLVRCWYEAGRHSMTQTGFEWTPDFWQGWRESDNPYRIYKSERDRRLVLDLLQPRDGEKILEMGCGYGWISAALWNAARIEWYGVDRSESMIRNIRSARSEQAWRTAVVDGTQLPFPDNSFDKVLCTGVLMHIAEDVAAIHELLRVLRPGGALLCSFNNALSPFSIPVRLWNSRKKSFVQKFHTPGALRGILSRAGTKLSDMAGDGIVATVPISAGRV
ncbi:MAG: class I SAM-dependent methyltransferase, partial [Candidatus Acidiferrales bacterium]